MAYRSSCGYSFGHANKIEDNNFIHKEMLNTPNIGKYTNNIIISPKKGFHFGKDKKLKEQKVFSPGPGKYNDMAAFSKTQYNKNNAIKFAKEEKLKLKTNNNPGVGKYSITSSNDFGKSSKNKFSMSQTQRLNFIDTKKTSSSVANKNDIKALEPGLYEIKSTIGKEGIKPVLRGKPKEKKIISKIGPGSYLSAEAKVKTFKKDPSFTFSKSNRMEEIKEKVPGPGAYHIPCSVANLPGYDGGFKQI